MIQLEIAKKNNNELLIYSSLSGIFLALLIILVSRTTGYNNSFETADIIILFLLIAIAFIATKILPNIQFRKHSKIGNIYFHKYKVETNIGNFSEFYEIDKLEQLNIKVYGYDGQHRLGDINSLGKGNASLYPNMRPLNGLGNKIEFYSKGQHKEYGFYLNTIDNYNELIELTREWQRLNHSMKRKI